MPDVPAASPAPVPPSALLPALEQPALFTAYRQVRAKIEAHTEAGFASAADAVACTAGCASCCADGLSVLPVEAAYLLAAVVEEGIAPMETSALPVLRPERGCAFLDAGGRCRVYDARPVLCMTHGLGLRLEAGAEAQHCALNFKARAPHNAEIVDGTLMQAMLTLANQDVARALALPADARVPLRALMDQLSAWMDA